MKTLIKKLKLGVLLMGFVILTSCGNGFKAVTETSIQTINRSIPVLVVSATKFTGEKISKYLKKSVPAKADKELASKKAEKTVRKQKAKPISIGIVDSVRLVSSNSL